MSKAANKKNQIIVYVRMAILIAVVLVVFLLISKILTVLTEEKEVVPSETESDIVTEEMEEVPEEEELPTFTLNPDGSITGELLPQKEEEATDKFKMEEVEQVAYELPAGFEEFKSVVYTTTDANLRMLPNPEADKYMTLVANMPINTVGLNEEWYMVLYNNTACFVSSQVVSREPTGKGCGHVVVIDPGHQMNANDGVEPIGPDSTTTKQMATTGFTGVATSTNEYYLNQLIANGVYKELISRGYAAILTRANSDADISNAARAQLANDYNADIVIHLHCAASDNPSQSGAFSITTTSRNPYCGSYAYDSKNLADTILSSYCSATGMTNLGVTCSDEYTSLNWSKQPSIILEMGYLSNESDDTNMSAGGFENSMVQGIVHGINNYFGIE